MPEHINNEQDLIDSRDIIDRIDEIEYELDPDNGYERDDDETDELQEELRVLKRLAQECEDYAGGWQSGETLIRDSHFKECAQQLAKDIGAISDELGRPFSLVRSNELGWAMRHIDWDEAADELKADYTAADFNGVTYWARRQERHQMNTINSGFKFVAADLTTRDHEFSYLDALRTGRELVASSPTLLNNGACPWHEGDGLCVAHTVAAASSGGQPATSAVGLTVTYHQDAVLGEREGKVRVRALSVTGVFDPIHLIRLGLQPNLQDADLRDANLRGANLRGADLQGANLQSANLQDADLRGADLWDADLQGANLQSANLRGADLRGASLQSANLWDADLRDANLQDADLRDADLWDADLWDADLRCANLRGADLRGASLQSANLRGADLRDADLQSASLQGANLQGATNVPDYVRSTTT